MSLKNRRMRADPKFLERLRQAKIKRISNGLEKNPLKLSDREITRMMMNCPSWPPTMKELETIARKEDLE